jgi:hypothetical protein
MSTLFLSYARTDMDTVDPLVHALQSSGLQVWRDQDSLYSGQRWPKAIGEAIAAQKAVLLVWSQGAAQSPWVEFEWTTALALQKPLLLCHLDNTPLPPALQAVQSIPGNEGSATVQRLLAALQALPRSANAGRQQEVLATLPATVPATPEALTQALHSRFVQPGWQVGGNVYQATEMHITIGQGWLRTWHVWAALLVLLTVLALAFGVPDKVNKIWGGPAERLVLQTLAGVIWDEHRQGLAGVQVFVPELNLTTTTDARGYFHMQVRATPQRSVDLIASKSGYETRKIEAMLGNNNVQFIMRHP